MTYVVLTFPKPRTLTLVELTDNRDTAEWKHTFAPRPSALVRLDDPPAVLKVAGTVRAADLIHDPRFWAAIRTAIRAHLRRREEMPDLDRPHRKRRPWH